MLIATRTQHLVDFFAKQSRSTPLRCRTQTREFILIPPLGKLMSMPKRLSTASVMSALERGRYVTVDLSNRTIVLTLVVSLSVGAFIVVAFAFIIASNADQGVNFRMLAINLRIWAFFFGIIGCLVVAPVGVIVRLRRRESLVLSPSGIALARRGECVPNSLLPWTDIERIEFERRRAMTPRILSYLLTEDAARRVGHSRTAPRLRTVRSGFELNHRQLHPIFVAAHDRFSQHERR